jgi:hypothetical protein
VEGILLSIPKPQAAFSEAVYSAFHAVDIMERRRSGIG